jgi:hypothetical protein
MTIPEEFNDIRPYSPEELPQVFDELLADPQFLAVVKQIFPQMPVEDFARLLRSCTTNQEVQEKIIYGIVEMVEKKCTDSFDMDCSCISLDERYTFVSNHRDIVTDPSFLSKMLIDNGFPCTVEIAIGDNLLIYPWIHRLVRVNKSFIVQRSAQMREMLASSARMSRYMHFAISEKHENIWIAQREGRAKDSNDRTQDSILKMMAMGGEGDIVDRLMQLHIVPLSISCEYDPCDWLKAMEFQMKRDNPHYVKSRENDLLNMRTGIFGYKGRVHYAAAPCIDAWLATLPRDMQRNELFQTVAHHIDCAIFGGYRLYPANYVAADILHRTTQFSQHYSDDDKRKFGEYLEQQIQKIQIPAKDHAYLRERMLTMYANPAINFQSTQK